jgi:hypothetical protein
VYLVDCSCEERTDFIQGRVHEPKQHKNTLQGNIQEVPGTNKTAATKWWSPPYEGRVAALLRNKGRSSRLYCLWATKFRHEETLVIWRMAQNSGYPYTSKYYYYFFSFYVLIMTFEAKLSKWFLSRPFNIIVNVSWLKQIGIYKNYILPIVLYGSETRSLSH